MGKELHEVVDICQVDKLKAAIEASDFYPHDSNAEFTRSVKGATKPRYDWVTSGGGWEDPAPLMRVKSTRKSYLRALTREVVPKPSATELAMREFLKRVKQISNIKIRIYGGASPAEQSVLVEVPSILSPEARSVVHLQGEMYRKYPGASVRVDITESQIHASSADDIVRVER